MSHKITGIITGLVSHSETRARAGIPSLYTLQNPTVYGIDISQITAGRANSA